MFNAEDAEFAEDAEGVDAESGDAVKAGLKTCDTAGSEACATMRERRLVRNS